MQRALAEFTIAPLKTTIPFHRKVLAHPSFIAGTVDTGFVERTF
jgi:biotin carboxylase